MNKLYISDLDGTLLNKQAELSAYTIASLNNLICQGMNFTVATARTAASVTKILAPLTLKLPVILMNGVLLYDVQTKKYLSVHYLQKELVSLILKVIKKHELTGFLYKIQKDELSTYYEFLNSRVMQEFYEERVNKYQKLFIQVTDFNHMDSEHIIYFVLMNKKEHLEPVYESLKGCPHISMAYYKDIYYEEDIWYLEIFSSKATKYNAALALKKMKQYDYMVGFGDNINDLPLFEACDEACAVENAKEAVKAAATHIIDSNLNNGVARWLEKQL